MTLNSLKDNLKFMMSKFPYTLAVVFVVGVLLGHILQRFTG